MPSGVWVAPPPAAAQACSDIAYMVITPGEDNRGPGHCEFPRCAVGSYEAMYWTNDELRGYYTAAQVSKPPSRPRIIWDDFSLAYSCTPTRMHEVSCTTPLWTFASPLDRPNNPSATQCEAGPDISFDWGYDQGPQPLMDVHASINEHITSGATSLILMQTCLFWCGNS